MADSVSIIGTGDYARALAKKLLQYDFKVTLGSRCPEKRDLVQIDESLANARVTTYPQCIHASNIIFIAIHHEAHKSLQPFAPLLAEKIVVDVSNPSSRNISTSLVEQLQKILPHSHVVKAFNTISAYSLESQVSGERQVVYVCGNNLQAKKDVQDLARTIGFTTVDSGSLKKAISLEKTPLYLLQGWGAPTLVAVLIWIGWMLFCYLRYYVLRDSPYGWERLAANVTNKVFGCTSLTLLSLTYMPGCFAAFLQLKNGTKNRRFPSCLDQWMRMRKQLGLHALANACLHLCLSAILMNPVYYSGWYKENTVTVLVNRTADTVVTIDSRMNWNGEVCMLLGILGVFTMVLQGITSLPSVGALLNWREWTFVQSYLGFISLTISMLHVTVKGIPSWIDESFVDLIQRLTFTSCVLPWIVIFMRIIIWLPCVNKQIWKIRRGWERGATYDLESGAVTPKLDTHCMSIIGNGHVSNDHVSNGHVSNGHVSNGYISNGHVTKGTENKAFESAYL